jgi:fibrillarin-like rRNA methylase
MLLTKNMAIGESVYGEKRISVDVWSLFDCFNG